MMCDSFSEEYLVFQPSPEMMYSMSVTPTSEQYVPVRVGTRGAMVLYFYETEPQISLRLKVPKSFLIPPARLGLYRFRYRRVTKSVSNQFSWSYG